MKSYHGAFFYFGGRYSWSETVIDADNSGKHELQTWQAGCTENSHEA